MVTDAIVTFLAGIIQPLLELLPEGEALPLPAPASLLVPLAELNDVIPLSPVIAATVLMFALVIPMTAYRIIVHIRKMLLP